MATIIKIKNSGTQGAPTAVGTGELAYSYLGGTQANGGDRIYIGTGTETNGAAANVEVIGGKYFTGLLDHVHGTKTASAAVILDATGKIDTWDVDNVNIDGNTISSTDTNGDVVIDPNGTGTISLVGPTDVTGALDVTGSLDVSTTLDVTGQTTLASAAISDLTAGRVTLAGTAGELEDSANLTFDGSTLDVTGALDVSTTLDVTGQTTLSSAAISDLTAGRVTLAGTGGELEDSANLAFDGSTLDVTGNLGVTSQATLASAAISDLTSGRVTFAGTGGELEDSTNLTFNSGTGALDVTGSVDVDNIKIDGNTISATDLNGGVTITPTGTGGVTVNADTYLKVPTGTAGTRPTASSGLNSAIRYNETSNRFEGVVSGSWTGLGGVVDVDQDTYVTAEASTDEDKLRFFAAGTEEMVVDADGVTVGNINIDGSTISTTSADSSNTLYLDPNPTGSAGTVIVEGNLQVNGTTTTVNSTTTTVDDPIMTLGGDTAPTSDDNKDRGIEFQWYDTASSSAKVGFFGLDDSTGKFTFIKDATNTSEVFSGTAGDVAFGDVDIAGSLNLTSALAVASGGTGLTSFTANGVFTSNGAGNAVSFVASATEGHVLQINASGAPTFGHLDGGTY